MKYFFLLLLFSFLCLSNLSAQVGINNPNPSQALDVGGKIKVGDDQITPVAGTIRYNRVSKTFEGYDGAEWSVFNPEPEDDGGGGGSNTPVVGDQVRALIKRTGLGSSSTIEPVSWYYGTDYFGYILNVPSGRSIRVTSILVSPNSYAHSCIVTLTPMIDENNPVPNGEMQVYSDQEATPFYFSDPTGQLLIIPSGGSLKVDYEGFSGSIKVIGYLE